MLTKGYDTSINMLMINGTAVMILLANESSSPVLQQLSVYVNISQHMQLNTAKFRAVKIYSYVNDDGMI